MELRGSNITTHVRQRSFEARRLRKKFQRSSHVTESMIHRMGLEKELEGHRGCVNCLEWNYDGTLLASGSDDLHAIIWDPQRHKQKCSLRTNHHGNIFSVKFLPNSNDSSIVTGAGDCKVHVHSIPRLETSEVYSCHVGRVKRIATAPDVPYMFWSAGEDGTVRQFDLRMPHNCGERCSNVIVNLNAYIGRHAECKCLAVNQSRPEQLAVGASDPYVRLYDMRMLSPHDVSFSYMEYLGHPLHSPTAEPDSQAQIPPNCVQYFIAGHLPAKESSRRGYRTLAITYLTFSPSGHELLVNIGGEQVYLFDVNTPRHPKLFKLGDYALRPGTNGVRKKDVSEHVAEVLSSNGTPNGVNRLHLVHSNGFHRMPSNCLPAAPSISKLTPAREAQFPNRNKPLSARAELLKMEANKYYCDRKDFTAAIRLYNQAISISPHSAVLYGNRAAAFMKRRWDGDLYAAIRDCHSALQLDPAHRKAHFRLARGLLELSWIKEARICLEQFKLKFPEYTKYKECQALDQDIRKAAIRETDLSGDLDPDRGAASSVEFHSPSRDQSLSEHELDVRGRAFDYQDRFCGHCNTTTDIKEANFFGSDGQYIMAGSDDGSFFIWDRKTTNIIRVLRGDDSIVNCLQPHPTSCFVASSGIDPVIRLWSPRPEVVLWMENKLEEVDRGYIHGDLPAHRYEHSVVYYILFENFIDGSMEERCIKEADSAATANQRRMKADPFEVMLLNMGLSTSSTTGENSDDEGSERPVHCQQS